MMIIVRVLVVNRGAPAAQQQVSIKYVSGLIQTISLSLVKKEICLFSQSIRRRDDPYQADCFIISPTNRLIIRILYLLA